MATWVHFSSYLGGTRPITKDERDELFDQLENLLITCSSRWSVNYSGQVAIKTSGLLTDRASVTDATLATTTAERFASVLSTVSGEFSNYSTVVTAALSAEGITSAERDAIVASGLDDHRLWNYYQRVIDGLACTPASCLGSFSNSGYISVTHTARCLQNTAYPSITPCVPIGAGETLYIYLNVFGGSITLKISIDGVLLYDSGARTTEVCATIALPTGSEEIVIEITVAGFLPGWYYSIGCTPRVQCP